MSNSYVPYSTRIHIQAERILKLKQYVKDCLEAGICPKCGYILKDVKEKEGFHYNHYLKCSIEGCNYKQFMGVNLFQ